MTDTDINRGITQELPAVKRTFKMLQPTKDALRDDLADARAAIKRLVDRQIELARALEVERRAGKVFAWIAAGCGFGIGGVIGALL